MEVLQKFSGVPEEVGIGFRAEILSCGWIPREPGRQNPVTTETGVMLQGANHAGHREFPSIVQEGQGGWLTQDGTHVPE